MINNKRVLNGYIAEHKFLLECLKRNLVIYVPLINIYPYDAIIVGEKGCYKIQVKKAYQTNDEKSKRIDMRSISLRSRNKVAERLINNFAKLSDFIVAVWGEDFYIIPQTEIKAKGQLCIRQYSKYINKFDQLT